ncbi:MAG TPA: hypothetical protein VFY71_12360 [Planctomycetota bacterium]|nr:hypothetical protein [Planctomycetota bacterium]
MLRAISLALALTLLGGCTVVDLGVARGVDPTEWTWGGAGGYADCAWPANDMLLTADVLGGAHSGALVSVDVWRLLHLELGLFGLGVGVGPLQIGGGVGWYTPKAPASLHGSNPFVWNDHKMEHEK